MRRVKLRDIWTALVLLVTAMTAVVFTSCEPPASKVDVADTAVLDSVSVASVSADALSEEDVQPPPPRRLYRSPLAGSWYEADKDALAAVLNGYLEKTPDEHLANVCALISPHAGYPWSGPTAAYGGKQLAGRKFSRVVVLGPTHRLPMENVASVPAATHYSTPLGEVPLDWRFLSELKKHAVFRAIPHAHDGEHSVQIQLPLLQHVLPAFQLVPIVVGQLDNETTRHVARILLGLVDEDTLVVASSDFTHYGSNFSYTPFKENVAENLKRLDMGAVEQIKHKDLDGFSRYVRKTEATICGRHPIGVLLAMLPAESKSHLLHYDTSGRMLGDHSSSVSYVSVAFTGRWTQGKRVAVKLDAVSLSDEDKEQLLKLARGSLEYGLKNQRRPSLGQLDVRLTPAMKTVLGAFVTLHKQGQLRGCVGEIYPIRPLYKAVMAHAVNAGVNDRRFSPVEQSEVPELDFEISALTPPCPVGSVDEIVIGKHGIVLEKDGRSAVFLPQVAVEQGWGLEETFGQLARKAGLPQEAWKNGASFTVFEAIVFGEDDE